MAVCSKRDPERFYKTSNIRLGHYCLAGRARLIDDRNAQILRALGCLYAVSGKRAEAQQVLDELYEESKQNYVSPYFIAMIYFALGDKDQGFSWLEKADEDRSKTLIWLKVDPELDLLRSDPRFAALLKRLNLPQ